MIPLSIYVEGNVGIMVSQRQQIRALKYTHLTVARYWQNHYKMLHFRRSAKSRYKYFRRTPKYLAHKKKAAMQGTVLDGGGTDLVYSGTTKLMVMLRHPIKAYPTRATLTMQVPKYITYRKGRATARLAHEIEVHTPKEMERLSEVGVKVLKVKLTQTRRSRRRIR